jgi:hypothetical protein
MISITWIFFIIVCKYKDEGGMKKGLNRFAGLKFNGLMLEVLFVLKERFKRFKKGLNIFNPYKRLEVFFKNYQIFFIKTLCLCAFASSCKKMLQAFRHSVFQFSLRSLLPSPFGERIWDGGQYQTPNHKQ